MRIAVVDDDEADRTRLLEHIRACRSLDALSPTVEEYSDGDELLKARRYYDLVFLDVLMERCGGIECALKLRRQGVSSLVVLITSSPDYLHEGYRIHAFDYLLKGFTQEAFDRTCADALKALLPCMHETIVVPTGAGPLSIKLEDFVSAKTSGHYVLVRTVSGTIKVRMTFSQLMDRIPPRSCLFVCNRGTVVNLAHAKSVEDEVFCMDDGERVPIKRKLCADAKRAYLDYLTQRYLQDGRRASS